MQQQLNEQSQSVENVQPNQIIDQESTDNNVSVEQNDPFEGRARERGWRPKEEWNGQPDEWRSAREFIERGELLDTIHKVTRENKEIKKVLGNVEDLIERREKMAAEKAIQELKSARREAIQNGDIETVEKLDQHIDKTQQEIKSFEREKDSKTPPEVLDWVNKHRDNWFNDKSLENLEMMEEASRVEQRIHRLNPAITHIEALEMVEKEIRRKYSHRFNNSSKITKRPDVEGESGESRTIKKKSNYSTSDITPELDDIAKLMVKKGVFKTKDDYFKKYFGG